MVDLIKPAIVKIADCDGVEKEFIVSRIPAIQAREIFTQYLTANAPKVGNYAVSEALMLKMMSYVGIPKEEGSLEPHVMLKTAALVNNHALDFEQLGRLEIAMVQHNVSFFQPEKVSSFLSGLAQKLMGSAIQTLTGSLGQLSPTDKPA